MAKRDFTETFADAIKQIREELIDRGWFSRGHPPGASDWFGRALGSGRSQSTTIIDARETTNTAIDASQRSVSLTLGWDFGKEPSRDREGPAHDLDR